MGKTKNFPRILQDVTLVAAVFKNGQSLGKHYTFRNGHNYTIRNYIQIDDFASRIRQVPLEQRDRIFYHIFQLLLLPIFRAVIQQNRQNVIDVHSVFILSLTFVAFRQVGQKLHRQFRIPIAFMLEQNADFQRLTVRVLTDINHVREKFFHLFIDKTFAASVFQCFQAQTVQNVRPQKMLEKYAHLRDR